jgi:hypothetical protein
MKIKFMRKLLMHARSFQFSRVLKWLFWLKVNENLIIHARCWKWKRETRLLNNKFRLLTEKCFKRFFTRFHRCQFTSLSRKLDNAIKIVKNYQNFCHQQEMELGQLC